MKTIPFTPLLHKLLLWVLAISVFMLETKAQDQFYPTEGPGFYFNQFHKFRSYSKDSVTGVDSATYYVKKLAADPKGKYSLESLLHQSFNQSFINWTERKKVTDRQKLIRDGMARIILQNMADDNSPVLSQSVKPLLLWVQLQENINDATRVKAIANTFITEQLATKDISTHATGRYALLMSKLLKDNTPLQQLADKIFAQTFSKLKTGLPGVSPDTASRAALDKRAWYRYLLAYCNYVTANKYLAQNNISCAKRFLQSAAYYSPDDFDRNTRSSYFYDMHLLFGKDKESFQEDYIEYLAKYGTNKKESLDLLLSTTLIYPKHKGRLASYYNEYFGREKSFNDYWLDAINKTAKITPAYSIVQMDGKPFSIKDLKGKWILLDFWGTWCMPCRQEHPELDKFYKEIKSESPDRIAMTTVACRDDSTKVSEYLKKYKYSFPVAMSDGKIEKVFPVKGYPAKFLITPQGRFIEVPLGIDWVGFVKEYTGL